MSSILDRDTFGAFCRHTHATMSGRPGGPLSGLTFAAKDTYDVVGYRTGFGSPEWLATHDAATATAPVLQRLLDAGAELVGKTHTDELTYSLNGENAHYGTPVNPRAPERIPGGSSSGSAVAVAAGLVDFALGTDTGGSVRAPSSFCGIHGIRPTHGATSHDGIRPLAHSFDTAGWFAPGAALLERLGRVILDANGPAAAPTRLLVAEDAFALLRPAAAAALQPALGRLQELVARAHPVTLAAEGLPQWFQVARIAQAAEVWAEHGAWVTRIGPKLGPGVKERMAFAATVSAQDAAAARARRAVIAAQLHALLGDDTILALPTVSDIAPLRDTPFEELEKFRVPALSLLCVSGLAGLPQVSLPVSVLDGCPFGLSLIGPRGTDMMLLETARRFEAAADGR